MASVKPGGLRGMKKVVGERDDFVMDALFYFEPGHRFEYFQLWGSNYGTSKGFFEVAGDEILFLRYV